MAIRDLTPWRKRLMEMEEELLVPAWRGPAELFRDFFEDLFRHGMPVSWRQMQQGMSAFSPDVDVSETDKEYKVVVELPGLSKDEINVSVREGSMTISGEKKEEEQEEKENYLKVERSHGSFTRTILLPSSVREDAIEATFEEGVLRIRLPKTEETRGEKLEI